MKLVNFVKFCSKNSHLKDANFHPLGCQQQPSSGSFAGVVAPTQQRRALRLCIAIGGTMQTEVGTSKHAIEIHRIYPSLPIIMQII